MLTVEGTTGQRPVEVRGGVRWCVCGHPGGGAAPSSARRHCGNAGLLQPPQKPPCTQRRFGDGADFIGGGGWLEWVGGVNYLLFLQTTAMPEAGCEGVQWLGQPCVNEWCIMRKAEDTHTHTPSSFITQDTDAPLAAPEPPTARRPTQQWNGHPLTCGSYSWKSGNTSAKLLPTLACFS